MNMLETRDAYAIRLEKVLFDASPLERDTLKKVVLNPKAPHGGFPENYARVMETGTSDAETLSRSDEMLEICATREELLAQGKMRPTLLAVLVLAGVDIYSLKESTVDALNNIAEDYMRGSSPTPYRKRFCS